MNTMYNKCVRAFLLIVAIVAILCSSACSRVTITLDANGGKVNGKSSIKHTITNSDTFNMVPDAEREGYSFNGWYTAATGGTKMTKNSPAPTKNTTYYAHWTAKQITIIWNTNGGSLNCSSSQTVGTKLKLCTSQPTRDGYTFDGWYTAKTGGTKITTSIIVPTKNTTYYAHWKAKQVTIIWHPNGGSPSYKGTRTVGTLMKLCEYTPTRDGYSFAGWYTAATGGTKITTSTIVPPKGTTYYYAHWTKGSTAGFGESMLPIQPTQPVSPFLPSPWSVDSDRVIQGTLKIDAKLYKDKECKTVFDGSMSQGGSVQLRGSVTSTGDNITKINAGFKDSSEKNWLKVGDKQYPVTVTPNAKTYDLKEIDSSISFGKLEVGKYKFVIEATNAYDERQTFSTNVEVGKPKTKIVKKDSSVNIEDVDARLLTRLQEMGEYYGISQIVISEGFRSSEQQQYFYDLYLSGQGNPANRPGYSWHEYGGAVDIVQWDKSLTDADYAKFGLSRPAMPKETWHIQLTETKSSPKTNPTEGSAYFNSITKWG